MNKKICGNFDSHWFGTSERIRTECAVDAAPPAAVWVDVATCKSCGRIEVIARFDRDGHKILD